MNSEQTNAQYGDKERFSDACRALYGSVSSRTTEQLLSFSRLQGCQPFCISAFGNLGSNTHSNSMTFSYFYEEVSKR